MFIRPEATLVSASNRGAHQRTNPHSTSKSKAIFKLQTVGYNFFFKKNHAWLMLYSPAGTAKSRPTRHVTKSGRGSDQMLGRSGSLSKPERASLCENEVCKLHQTKQSANSEDVLLLWRWLHPVLHLTHQIAAPRQNWLCCKNPCPRRWQSLQCGFGT